MRIKSFNSLLALIGIALSCASANASLIYESFSQDTSSTIILNGKAGGTGLSGNWTSTTGGSAVNVVNPPTLSYGDLASAGGQANVLSSGNTNARITTTTVLADAGLLDNGASLWFSMVYQKAQGGGSNEHSGFAFGTSHLTAGPGGVLMNNTGSGLGFYSRNNSANVATWSGGVNQTAATVGSGHALTYGSPTLLVGRIDWGATAGDVETITFYNVSLSELGTLGTGHSRTVAAFDQANATTISFTQRNSGGIVIYDEIRFGATYASVTPIPEPTTALLGGLGLLALLRRRR